MMGDRPFVILGLGWFGLGAYSTPTRHNVPLILCLGLSLIGMLFLVGICIFLHSKLFAIGVDDTHSSHGDGDGDGGVQK